MYNIARIIRSTIFFLAIAAIAVFPWLEVSAQPPIVQGVVPDTGHQGEQDLLLTITGQNFESGAQVFFENIGITVDGPVTYIDPNTLEAVIDIDMTAPLGPGDVFVINPDFQQGALPDGFEVIEPEPPQPESVVPGQAYTGTAGLSVTIQGLLMYTAKGVDFGSGITVDSVDNVTSTTVECTISIDWLATPGFRDVTVLSDYGNGILEGGFEVLAYDPPVINAIDPTERCKGDSNVIITVSGSDFLDGITFDFQPSANIVINSVQYDSPIQATLNVDIPLGAAVLSYSLIGTNPDGQYEILPSAFQVLDCGPKIESIDPTQGTQGDVGLPVMITGTSFGDVTDVSFGAGVTVDVVSFTDTEIDVLLDIFLTATPGFRDVTVMNAYGFDIAFDGFEVLESPIKPPSIVSIDPTQGTQGDVGLPVAIYGQYLDTVTSVDFGSDITVAIISVTADQIDVELDIDPLATPGFRDVSVNGESGGDTLFNSFEVLAAPPEIQSVDPNQGERGQQNLAVTIFGANLQSVDSVSFGSGIDVLVTGTSANQVDVELDILESAALGFRDVGVSSPVGDYLLPSGFEVVIGPLSIENVVPGQGVQGETLDVIITGQNMDFVSQVDFGAGIAVNSFDVAAANQIDANITIDPLADLGFRDVTITDVDLQFDTLVYGFEVTESPIVLPTIFTIEPDQGYQDDTDLEVHFTGQDFQDGLTVDFGHPGIHITQLIFGSASSFDVFMDIDWDATPGLTDVVVANPDGGEDIAVGGFEVLYKEQPLPPPVIDSVVPDAAYQGDTFDFNIIGQDFQTGAIAEFFPDGTSFDLSLDVSSENLINGSVTVHDDAPVGLYSVRVTNPDSQEAELTDCFEVVEKIEPPVNPPEPGNLIPTEVCIGAVNEVLTLWGQFFQPGIVAEFSYDGMPTDAIYDVGTLFIDSGTIEITLSVTDDAVAGLYGLTVTNPDGQDGIAPPLEVIDCAQPQGFLEWEETLIDVLIEYEGLAGEMVERTAIGHILNTGDGGYENVVISMTDLVSPDGRTISPESVEIAPSIIGEFGAQESQEVTVIFTIPMDVELLADGGGVFMGSMIAQDTVTGDEASVAVSVTIVTPGMQYVPVDPGCLTVDLLGPGASADFIPASMYGDPAGLPSEAAELLGGCDTAFPLFEWASYADGCPGYPETWRPSYTLTVYPVYPSQSAEEGVSNTPVWRETGLTDTYIAYPPSAEQLAGFYMWQVEAIPEANPGSGVTVGPLAPVYSDIWVFCVEGEVPGAPPLPPIEGDLLWVPAEQTINGCGMVSEVLVISSRAAESIGGNTSFSLTIIDEDAGSVPIGLNMAGMQFSGSNPAPDFGPAAIEFGVNVTPRDFIGGGMNPSDLLVQIYNGGVFLGEMQLDPGSLGRLKLKADIGGSTAECSILLVFPWDDQPCWAAWSEWWNLKHEVEEGCGGEVTALQEAVDALLKAEGRYVAASEAYQSASSAYASAVVASNKAQDGMDDAVQACRDFFSMHVDPANFSFTSPGEGWGYMEAFGGAIGVWYNGEAGAQAVNAVMETFAGEYQNIWDALKIAEEALTEADNDMYTASQARSLAEDDASEAASALAEAKAAHQDALTALNDCLQRQADAQAQISWLEWANYDCFRQLPGGQTGSGIGVPGFEGGPQGPPMGGEPGDTGIGSNPGGCPCGDCSGEWQAVKDAEEALDSARSNLDLAREEMEDLKESLDQANEYLFEARAAANAAEASRDALRYQLDTFVDTHVFSDAVGSTPDHGSNHFNYKGVDIYFSDPDVFSAIFEAMMPLIDELAQQLADAEAAAMQADEALLEAQMTVDNFTAVLLSDQNQVTELQSRVGQAEIAAAKARDSYNGCVDQQKLCHIMNGCPPYVAPHEAEGTEGETGAYPPGLPTVPTEGEPGLPACDCSSEQDSYTFAQEVLANAQAALEAAQSAFEYALDYLDEVGGRFADASAEVSQIEAALDALDPSDPGFAEQHSYLEGLLSDANLELTLAEAARDAAAQAMQAASANLDTAWLQVESAQLLVDIAGGAYDDCLRRQTAYNDQWGLGGGQGGQIGGDKGVPGAPGGGQAPGEGEQQVGKCPCETCEKEFEAVRQAKKAMDAAIDAWAKAFVALGQAEDAYAKAKEDEAKAQAEFDEAQKAVNGLQSLLNNFLAKTLAGTGVGTTQASGSQSVTESGVTLYFNNLGKFQKVFPNVRDGIKAINAELAKERQRLEKARKALDDAKYAALQAEARLNTAKSAEALAFEAARSACNAYNQAVDDYFKCIMDRAQCINDHPVECANERLEPDGGLAEIEGRSENSGGSGGENRQQSSSGMDGWSESQSGAAEGIQSDLADAAQGLQGASSELQAAQEACGELASALDDATTALAAYIQDLVQSTDRLDEIAGTLPDGAFMLENPLNPPEGYESRTVGEMIICFPEGAGDAIDAWLQENQAALEETHMRGLGDGALPEAVVEAVERYALALERLQEASGRKAGLGAAVDVLNGFYEEWTEAIETRNLEIGELLSQLQQLRDELETIKAEFE